MPATATAAPLPQPLAQSAPPKSPENASVAAPAAKPTATQTIKVTFVLFDLGAKQVSLSGEFNGWSLSATPMKRQDGGHWETTIALAPGRYQYKFVVDGEWIPDPLARENVWNQHGTLNSVLEVRT
jgi:1,4-alpha-glucan branching enzyme